MNNPQDRSIIHTPFNLDTAPLNELNDQLNDGIYSKLDIDLYHQLSGVSSSAISELLKAPKKYWYKYLSGEFVQQESKALTLGKALHEYVLEPETFHDNFFCLPKIDRRTKDGKFMYSTIMKEAGNKKPLSLDEFDQVKGMAESLHEHPIFSKFIKEAFIEHSLLMTDKETGVRLKSRPDFYTKDFIFDLKTTDNAQEFAYANKAYDFGYHRQAALSYDCLQELTGRSYDQEVHLFVVEKAPPYLVALYTLDDHHIEPGRKQYQTALVKYKDCLDSGVWPGYSPEAVPLKVSYKLMSEFISE
jgi:hypothetical protein